MTWFFVRHSPDEVTTNNDVGDWDLQRQKKQ
jgi:hypothetical protein